MEIKYLLKSQANQLFEELTNDGWNPAEFKWEETRSPNYGIKFTISRLTHFPSGYYFSFDNVGGFHSVWSPDNEKKSKGADLKSWANQLKRFKEWLGYLKREVESPDLWSAISQESEIAEAAAADESNTPFSVEEKAYILSGITEIKQYLLTAHKLDPELVEARLNYLAEAADRVGRKDWINLLLSVLVGIIIQAAVPSDSSRELFRFVGTVLHKILRSQLALP
jgi:hypothetical protein